MYKINSKGNVWKCSILEVRKFIKTLSRTHILVCQMKIIKLLSKELSLELYASYLTRYFKL